MQSSQAEQRELPAAELVVQNGRLAGSKRPLCGPLTLIGQGSGCDIRLNVDGVNPLHCLIAQHDGGYLIRDLESAGGTFVNGERVNAAPLQTGDVLTISSIQFRLERRESDVERAAGAPAADVESQRDALRIQAAAVAAQQAALLEEESRLQQQQGALSKQQEQLAAHLEEKRQRLVQLSDQVQAARMALQHEREEFERQTARQVKEHATRQAALEAQAKKLQEDQKCSATARRRLKERLHKRVKAEQQRLQHLEQAHKAQQHQVAREWDKLKKEQDSIQQSRLICNGEIELGKRLLQFEWQKLWREQTQLKIDSEQKETALAGRARALRQREDALRDAERALGDDRHQWELRRKIVEQEVNGLETRLIQQRRRLNELQAELSKADARARDDASQTLLVGIPVEQAPAVGETKVPEGMTPEEAHLRELEAQINSRTACLTRLADDLSDQRLELVEQWLRLAQTQHEWNQSHAECMHELECLSAGLPIREEAIVLRQEALTNSEDDFRIRQRELLQFQQHLEGWAAKVRLREASWQAERDQLLTDVTSREALAEKHLSAIGVFRQRWIKRRRHEIEQLRAEGAACEQLRQEYAGLRQEWWKRALALEQQERDLSEKTLALEEYRQQCVLRSQDAAGADAKLDRLRKRWQQDNAATMRATTEQFQRLQQESAHLQQRGRELLAVDEDLTRRETALVQRQAAWEEQALKAQAEQERLTQQVQSLQNQQQLGQVHIADLQQEVERLAGALLDETEPPAQALAA
jgi:pSer/pThr/pTyr-binding forkhead associated (FHA) protein